MSVIYDKALKRKDISGRVSKRRDGEGSKVKKDDTGADVGKIVNLMSGDASRVSAHLLSIFFQSHSYPGCPDRLRDVFHLWMSDWYSKFIVVHCE